ncbi:MAG: MFS transporter [Proteobacteria bacterium]|nr:MFS transporter [Pseudomonadota bacterium]
MSLQTGARTPLAARLPFFYGWIIIAVAFVTVAVSVTARTAFSLMFPPIVDEFGWDRGLAAGAFSFGFLVSAVISPIVGRTMDRRGPRFVIEIGVVLTAAGLLGATMIHAPWQLYATLGLLVGAGANCMSFSVQSQYLPNWFARRRALAIGIAFSGVGVGAILILPWLQTIILKEGWRSACWALGLMTLVVLLPINLIVAKRPQDLGLHPDGAKEEGVAAARRAATVVDPAWTAIEWTVAKAVRTQRFWWLVVGFFSAGYAWYAIQVHQTKYLVEIGFSPMQAAWSLGLVAMVAIPGQIFLGGLSDRIGREIVWTIASLGFVICYAALLALAGTPSQPLLYVMVLSQGVLGYAFTSLMGAVVAEIFEGPHFGSIFSLIMVSLLAGGAAGPYVTGVLHDIEGDYTAAFAVALGFSALGAVSIWFAAPGKVRMVAGKSPTR